ncbi:unnamed protein product [Caenorhabditis angaria]|uniref:Uncharacterized protein n=1 Tax=Caenorhabditis angaria TaxID=860376 RepID=A0A9P1N6F7_9PELO|nr:unnamed protein product [Caenorhabditis angaria]
MEQIYEKHKEIFLNVVLPTIPDDKYVLYEMVLEVMTDKLEAAFPGQTNLLTGYNPFRMIEFENQHLDIITQGGVELVKRRQTPKEPEDRDPRRQKVIENFEVALAECMNAGVLEWNRLAKKENGCSEFCHNYVKQNIGKFIKKEDNLPDDAFMQKCLEMWKDVIDGI